MLSLLIKPASSLCNMACNYCFYRDEVKNRSVRSYGMMDQRTAHCIIDKAFEEDNQVHFAFQGGEPTMIGLNFYRDFVSYVGNRQAVYSLQTNGILVDDEWASFFKEYDFLIGLSLDGPKAMHNDNRIDLNDCPTFDKVMTCVEVLKRHQVDFNILCVVNGISRAKQIKHFFDQNNLNFQQYIECLDPLNEEPFQNAYSLTPKKYEQFLKEMFDEYYSDIKKGKYPYNRYFENLMMILTNQEAESCAYRGVCNNNWTIEANGNVYPCDFYVMDEYCLGNMKEQNFEDFKKKSKEIGFIEESHNISIDCQDCKWYYLCRNGCRRNRINGKNIFCEAYYHFFEYAGLRLVEIINILVNR